MLTFENIFNFKYFNFIRKICIAEDIPIIVITASKNHSLRQPLKISNNFDEKFFNETNEYFLDALASQNTSSNFFKAAVMVQLPQFS